MFNVQCSIIFDLSNTHNMTRIINNTQITLSPECQQSIRNACANIGIDTVVIKDDMHPDYPFVSVSDKQENKLFYVNIFSSEIHPY